MNYPQAWTFTLLLLYDLANTYRAAIQYSVFEEQAAGTFIGNVEMSAESLLNMTSTKLHYSLLNTNQSQYFSLHDTNLFTKMVLDREALCPFVQKCILRLTVEAMGQDDAFFKQLGVEISVVDLNDNVPIFPEPDYHITVTENSPLGTALMLPTAVDRDDTETQNGIVSYTLLSPDNQVFGIQNTLHVNGATSLHLDLKHSLDREVNNRYSLIILAKDGGSPARTGTLTVNIDVQDVNDNHPIFSLSTYDVMLLTDVLIGTEVVAVKAIDVDIGENGLISYSLLGSHAGFGIDPATGIVRTVTSIRNKTESDVELLVKATDHGLPPLSSTAHVSIELIGGNGPAVG